MALKSAVISLFFSNLVYLIWQTLGVLLCLIEERSTNTYMHVVLFLASMATAPELLSMCMEHLYSHCSAMGGLGRHLYKDCYHCCCVLPGFRVRSPLARSWCQVCVITGSTGPRGPSGCLWQHHHGMETCHQACNW